MADLFGTYDKRIKLTVSNTNIDAELTWFPVTVILDGTTVDVGNAATNRDSGSSPNYTIVSKGNPSNTTGTITSIEIWANTDMSNVEVGTFYVVSGANLTCRDSQAIGSVTSGSKQTLTSTLGDSLKLRLISPYLLGIGAYSVAWWD